MDLTQFINNLINGESGLKCGFLNCCYSSTSLLKEQLEKCIHFQTTTITEMPSFLAVELDYGSFKCLFRFDVANSEYCEFKKIQDITPIMAQEPTEMEFQIDTASH